MFFFLKILLRGTPVLYQYSIKFTWRKDTHFAEKLLGRHHGGLLGTGRHWLGKSCKCGACTQHTLRFTCPETHSNSTWLWDLGKSNKQSVLSMEHQDTEYQMLTDTSSTLSFSESLLQDDSALIFLHHSDRLNTVQCYSSPCRRTCRFLLLVWERVSLSPILYFSSEA